MKEQKYNAYLKEIGKFIPKDRIYTDELRLLASMPVMVTLSMFSFILML